MSDEVIMSPLASTPAGGVSCLFDGDESKCNAVLGVKKAFASLSLIGCLFMIAVIWIFRKYTLYVQRLILMLTISAFFQSTAELMQKNRVDSGVCNFEAWWTSFWDWAVLLWVSCITFNLLLIIIWMLHTEKYEIVYHAVTWGITLLMACIPLIGDHYGPAGAWCWIKVDYPLWRFFIWYGPLFLLIFAMFIVYAYISYKLSRRIRSWQGTYEPEIERNRQLIKEEIKPIRAYPFIYLVLSIFPLINRIQNAVAPDNPVFALYLLHAMSNPLVGAVNAVVYGMDPETRSRLTFAQIKIAILSHRAERAEIQEYTIHSDEQQPHEELGAGGGGVAGEVDAGLNVDVDCNEKRDQSDAGMGSEGEALGIKAGAEDRGLEVVC